jgi:hypothetical protein
MNKECEVKLNLFTSIDLFHNQLNKLSDGNNYFKLYVDKWSNLNFPNDLYFSLYNTLEFYESYEPTKPFTGDQEYVVSMYSKEYLKPPHGECSDYSDKYSYNLRDKTEHKITNQWQCYRQCLKMFGQQKFNCKPVFIENTIHELDFASNDFKDCNPSNQRRFNEYVSANTLKKKCLKVCPKDCLVIDFKIKVIKYPIDRETYNKITHYEKSVHFDSTQPIFKYKEEAVFSFTDYLCYCGGLVGLWFGISAKDIVEMIFENRIWELIFQKLFYMKNRNRVIDVRPRS